MINNLLCHFLHSTVTNRHFLHRFYRSYGWLSCKWKHYGRFNIKHACPSVLVFNMYLSRNFVCLSESTYTNQILLTLLTVILSWFNDDAVMILFFFKCYSPGRSFTPRVSLSAAFVICCNYSTLCVRHLCRNSCQYKFTVFFSSATSLLIHPEESSEVHTATLRECFALKILLSRCKFEKRRKKKILSLIMHNVRRHRAIYIFNY